MASITISAERIALVESTIRKFVASFSKPIDSVEDFVSVFHPDVDWYDHPFLMHRVGHDALVGLHKSFTHCNQPFDAEIKVSGLKQPELIPLPYTRDHIDNGLHARLSHQYPQVQSWNKFG